MASRGMSDEPLLALSSQFALSELSSLRLTLANRRAKVEAAVAAYQADWESVMAKVAIMSPK